MEAAAEDAAGCYTVVLSCDQKSWEERDLLRELEKKCAHHKNLCAPHPAGSLCRSALCSALFAAALLCRSAGFVGFTPGRCGPEWRFFSFSHVRCRSCVCSLSLGPRE